MPLLLNIFLIGDILLSLVAAPMLAGGLGFGSGAAGSSFFQKPDFNNTFDQQATLDIIKETCDPEIWNKQASSLKLPNFPTQNSDIATLAKADATAFNGVCVGQKFDEKTKMPTKGFSFEEGNAAAIANLFRGKWDKRTLYAIDYLYRKNLLNNKGIKCEDGDKTAVKLSLRVTGTGKEDDSPENVSSPHTQGQAFDVLTFGCTVTKTGGTIDNIFPTSIQLGQNSQATGASFAPSDNTAGSADINRSSNLLTAGITKLDQLGASPMAIASGVGSTQDKSDLLNNAFASNNIEDVAATINERVLEKKLDLPADSLQKGADAKQIGLAAFPELTGMDFPTIPISAKDTPLLYSYLSQPQSGYALSIPDQASKLLLAGQTDAGLAVIGAEYAAKTGQELSQADLDRIAAGQPMSDAAISAQINANGSLSNEEKSQARVLLAKGRDALKTEIAKTADQQSKLVSSQLAVKLGDMSQLTKEQQSILSDFMSPDKVVRDGAIRRFQQTDKSSQVIAWMQANQNLSAEEAALCQATLTAYRNSSSLQDFKQKMLPNVYTLTISQGLNYLSQEDYQTLVTTFGGPPTYQQLEAAVKNGQMQTVAETVALSRVLARAGLTRTEADQIATGALSKSASSQQIAISIINSRFSAQLGYTFTKADFTAVKGGQYPQVAQQIAYAQIAQKTGIDPRVVQAAYKGDAASQGKLAATATAKLGLPSWAQSAVSSYFSKRTDEQTTNIAKVGVKAKADSIANSLEENADKKAETSSKLQQTFNKGLESGKEKAREMASDQLTKAGISTDDAKRIAGGNLKGAEDSAIAAVLTKHGYGPYDLAKRIVSGTATKDEKYGYADAQINQFLAGKGINIQANGFSKNLLEGSSDQRKEVMVDIGAQLGANALVDQAGKMGIKLSKDAAYQLVKDRNSDAIKAAGEDAAFNKASQATGNMVSSETLKSIYNNAKSSGGLSSKDAETVGWDIVGQKTGVSKQMIDNLTTNFKGFKADLAGKFSNISSAIGASSIIANVVGQQLVQFDPTGGLLTSFAMGYVQKWIMQLGLSNPVMLGIALILDPQAVIASIKQMLSLAMKLFTDPVGFIIGLASMFGLGPKPKMGVMVGDAKAFKNYSTNEKNASGSSGSGTNTVPTTTDSSGQNTTDKSLSAGQTSSGGNNTSPANTQQPAAASSLSDFLAGLARSTVPEFKDPSPEQMKFISIRMTDIVVEDLLILSIIQKVDQKANPKFFKDNWSDFMGGLSLPITSMKVTQIICPRAWVDKSSATSDLMYVDDGAGGTVVGLKNIIQLAKFVYGSDLDPANAYGRKSGVLYSTTIPNLIHAGF